MKKHYNLYYLFLEDKINRAMSKAVKNKIWDHLQELKKRLKK